MKFKEYLKLAIYDDIPNNNLISEAGLSRLLKQYYDGNDFAIMSAYRKEYTKKENIKRNRNLRGQFDKRKMGVYQLVGHWKECQLKGVEYKDCPRDKIVDVVERSYMVVRPKDMTQEEFINLIKKLVKDYDQDAALISLDGKVKGIEANGNMFPIGDKLSLGKIAQGYSQHVRKLQVPFTFEGVEIPASISGFMCMKYHNLNRLVLSKEEYKQAKKWSDLI